MEEREIIEGNKLIADFVGLKLMWIQCNNHFDPVEHELKIVCPAFLDHDRDLMYLYDEENPIEHLKFHSSWDWLMPVVEKIESMSIVSDCVITHKCCYIIPVKGKKVSRYMSKESKIEATYKAVIEFITWHNNNQSK